MNEIQKTHTVRPSSADQNLCIRAKIQIGSVRNDEIHHSDVKNRWIPSDSRVFSVLIGALTPLTRPYISEY